MAAEEWAAITISLSPVPDDSDPPVITFVDPTPDNNTQTPKHWVYVNVTLNETGDTVLLEWDGATNYTMSGSGTNFYYNKTGIAYGEHTYRVYADDEVGNMNVTGIMNVSINTTHSTQGSVKDGSGSALSVDITVYDTDGSTVEDSSAGSSFNYNVKSGGYIMFDASSTKDVSAKFKINGSVSGATVYLDDKGTTNPLGTDPSGNAVKFINVTTYDLKFSSVEVKINYSDEGIESKENGLTVYHWTGSAWDELTTSVDTANNIVTATATSLSAFGVTYPTPTGNKNYQAPNFEVELSSGINSCGKESDGTSTCHLVKPSWPGFNTDKVTPDGYVEGGQHPGENRHVASFYPDWVHRQHSGTSWPLWEYNNTRDETCAIDAAQGDLWDNWCDNMTSPWYGDLSSGHNEREGGGEGDIAIRKNKYVADYETDWPWDTRPFRGDPDGANDRQYIMATCSYADTRALGNPSVNMDGCHGITHNSGESSDDSYTTDDPRDDTIPCTSCHNESNAATGTLFINHGSKDNCGECHFPGYGSSTVLDGDNPDATNTDHCDENCHTQMAGTGLRNTSYSHAGVDCRYCHGHAHNVTGVYSDDGSWNVTCGNNSDACHGSGAVNAAGVGGVQHNITAGNSPKCDECHVSNVGIGKAHNITIPSCGSCHNTTATGVKKTNMSVPNWMTHLNLSHGDEQRGSMGNISCALCHSSTTYHSSPTTNRDCQSTNCHGTSGSIPIAQTHSSVECWVCHNNQTIKEYMTFDGAKDLATNLHASNSSWIIPFNLTQTKTTFKNASCIMCHDNSSYIPQTAECHCCHSDGDDNLNIHSTGMSVSRTADDGLHGAQCTDCHYSYFSCFTDVFVNESEMSDGVHGLVSEDAFYCTSCHTNTSQHSSDYTDLPPESYWKWCECCHVAYQGQADGVSGGISKGAVSRHNLTGDIYTNYFYNDSQYDGANDLTLAKAIEVGYTVLNVTDCTQCHDSTLITNARTYYNSSTKDCRTCHPFPDYAKGGSLY